MTGLSNEAIWLFIALFVGIILLYGANMWKTIRFILKERPKDYEAKWKVRFPIIDHMKWTQEEKKIMLSLAALLLVIMGFKWIETDDNQFFSLLMVTFVFACLMITREFGIHYYIKGEELTIWSVHGKPYITKKGKDLLYRAIIKKSDIKLIKEEKSYIEIHTKKNQIVYVKGTKIEREEINKWLKTKK